MKEQWRIKFALPNLILRSPFEGNGLAIVPASDPRVVSIRKSSNVADLFLRGFHSQVGYAHEPSLLIVSDREMWDDREALTGFRNVLAMSTILLGWERYLEDDNPLRMLYSDYFQFYPVSLDHSEIYLMVGSPISGQQIVSKDFVACISPELIYDEVSDEYGHALASALMSIWYESHSANKETQTHRAILRSLHIAFQASKIPFQSQPTLYDYGTSLSLWVSAIDALLHCDADHVDRFYTLGILAEVPWNDKKLSIIRPIGERHKKFKKGTCIQEMYWQVYLRRNAFLHGNPVKIDDVYLFRNRSLRALHEIAPLIYLVLLIKESMPEFDPTLKANIESTLLHIMEQCEREGAFNDLH